ncbi:Glycoprotein-N-acetylgalactosamine 3-beta-galactosyltransferase 1 [Armadillidium vulgare]|nr:Glycoprotein-N-acetylgalactosamine 3-beta-galactosyltransferase 1 [Armadillidium vulgare]
MENLRHLLLPYNSSKPIWFGHRFKKFSKQGYMSGGAGYVLSQAAVKKFVEEALQDPKKCRADGKGAEDAELGKCLDKVGVIAMDSRDEKERGRFFPMAPDNHLISGKIGSKHWFWNYTFYDEKNGMNCCSDTAISFHYITPAKMTELEYFIYNVRLAQT